MTSPQPNITQSPPHFPDRDRDFAVCTDYPVTRLAIHQIRRDGQTQCRAATSGSRIGEYARQMAAGTEFPPVRVWFDGKHYWLSDGFQRVAAAESINKTEIIAELRYGNLDDARWDSYSANSRHGFRRSGADVAMAISLAIAHPRAAVLSNLELARYLNIPEPTVRRWRKKLSSSPDVDAGIRMVRRNGTIYPMRTGAIGQRTKPQYATPQHIRKTLNQLEVEMQEMKRLSSPQVRPLLNILANWAFGSAHTVDCVAAIEAAASRCNDTLLSMSRAKLP